MANFNGLGANLQTDWRYEDNESLCCNPWASAANEMKANVGTWEWHSVPNESTYTEVSTIGELTETLDERIERVVREVLKKLNGNYDLSAAPIILKYHIKHK